MKRILLVALILFLGIYGYSKYRQIQRFSPPTPYVYEISDQIDVNYYDQGQVTEYYQQVNELEQFVRASWSGHGIDVLYPRADKSLDQTLAEVYIDKKTRLQVIEGKLKRSAVLKEAGFSNGDIRSMELTGLSPEAFRAQQVIADFNQVLKVGDTGQIVYLIQQYLDNLEYEIMQDGIYKEITEEAIRSFQQEHGLLPTGAVDKYTMQKLYTVSHQR